MQAELAQVYHSRASDEITIVYLVNVEKKTNWQFYVRFKIL